MLGCLPTIINSDNIAFGGLPSLLLDMLAMNQVGRFFVLFITLLLWCTDYGPCTFFSAYPYEDRATVETASSAYGRYTAGQGRSIHVFGFDCPCSIFTVTGLAGPGVRFEVISSNAA